MKINGQNLLKKKFEGFTLLETLFVILLTSIVVSLIFVYFNTFQRYMLQINKTTDYEIQILRFESLMQFDLDRAKYIILKEEDPVKILLAETQINYVIGENFIVRNQNEVPDTLKATNISFIPMLLNESDFLLEGFIVNVIDFNNRTRDYAFYKKYDEKTNFEEFIKTKND